jgi:D-glycero-D-manno-heptose 1,7-bisphosphate phosphatase
VSDRIPVANPVAQARAVFLDRDGVINLNRPDYVKTWEEFRFAKGALKALARLASTRFKIVVVTNQSAVGRGILTQEGLEHIHRRMVHEIEQASGRVDLVVYCPHKPEDTCICRKPRPGMLVQAAKGLDIDLERSYMIGDSIGDLRAGRSAHCSVLLIGTGMGSEAAEYLNSHEPPSSHCPDLISAVDWIIKTEEKRSLRHLKAVQ